MKTTVDVPDSLYRQVKARAALEGQTIKTFLLDALRDKLAADKKKPDEQTGWRSVFGAADPEDVAEVQRIIDEEFSPEELKRQKSAVEEMLAEIESLPIEEPDDGFSGRDHDKVLYGDR